MTRRFQRISRKLVVHALPIKDRRQEQQQHHLAIDLNVTETGNQTQQGTGQDEQHWRAHAIAVAQDGPHDHGGDQRNDNDEPEHQPILAYGASTIHTAALTCFGTLANTARCWVDSVR